MVEVKLTLEQEFRIKKFQEFLAQHQNESEFWAITYFHNYLIQTQHYHSLKVEFVAMITQQSRLRINQYFSSKVKIFSNISLRSISLSVLIFLTNVNSLNSCYPCNIDNILLSYLGTETKIY